MFVDPPPCFLEGVANPKDIPNRRDHYRYNKINTDGCRKTPFPNYKALEKNNDGADLSSS